jgi:hypothetical protein
MLARHVALSATALGILGLLSGCASIMSGRHAEVRIESFPSNANVAIRDHRGLEVASLHTPGVARLKRNRQAFLPARYTATIEAPGYQPAQVPIGSTVNPWVLGNVLLGGLPGLVVDGATGAAWRPRQSHIHSELSALGGPQVGSSHGLPEPAHDGPPIPPHYVITDRPVERPDQHNAQK